MLVKIPPEKRRWVRKIGTDKSFQMTDAFAARLGKDMAEVSYKNHLKLRERLDNANKVRAQQNQMASIENAYAAHKRAGGSIMEIPDEPDMADIDLSAAETADEALARIVAEGGDDDGVVMTDGLDDMSRTDLFDLIAREDLPVKKYGKSMDLIRSIRSARAARVAASVDPGNDIPDGDDGTVGPEAAPESE